MRIGRSGRLAAASILAVLVAGAVLGRLALTRSAPIDSTFDPGRLDTSGHRVRFVEVEPGVKLEVLDWGGDGEDLVLLAGLGNTAHVFDDFAHQFTGRFHVIGITRRGFGRSGRTEEGYSIASRASDDLKVLDALGIRDASFVGHSIAGTELNAIGAAHPDRVKRLVYLDALDNGWGGWKDLPQPPGAPVPGVGDLESVQSLAAYFGRTDGFRVPIADLRQRVLTDPAGKVLDDVTPPEISRKILEGVEPAEYGRIKAPTLGIFFPITDRYRPPYYAELDGARRAEYDRAIGPLAGWIGRANRHFRDGVKGAVVVELPDSGHYLFLKDESSVVRAMRQFFER